MQKDEFFRRLFPVFGENENLVPTDPDPDSESAVFQLDRSQFPAGESIIKTGSCRIHFQHRCIHRMAGPVEQRMHHGFPVRGFETVGIHILRQRIDQRLDFTVERRSGFFSTS